MLKNDDYSFEDKLISGGPTKIDKDHLNNSLNENSHETTRELADKFECSKSSVNYHLKKLGKIHKSSAVVPYELIPNQNKKRVEICNNLLLRHKQTYGHYKRFHQTFTCDEKWCQYVNVVKRKEWLSPGSKTSPISKPPLHPKKALLCVWWNFKEAIY